MKVTAFTCTVFLKIRHKHAVLLLILNLRISMSYIFITVQPARDGVCRLSQPVGQCTSDKSGDQQDMQIGTETQVLLLQVTTFLFYAKNKPLQKM